MINSTQITAYLTFFDPRLLVYVLAITFTCWIAEIAEPETHHN